MGIVRLLFTCPVRTTMVLTCDFIFSSRSPPLLLATLRTALLRTTERRSSSFFGVYNPNPESKNYSSPPVLFNFRFVYSSEETDIDSCVLLGTTAAKANVSLFVCARPAVLVDPTA